VNLSFVAFSRYLGSIEGQVFVLFVMVVAAAEVAVGLAIAVAVFRERGTININDISLLKW
jgi:NADH-quinone oxidoreductase subunit K